jgi:hypothetical protein
MVAPERLAEAENATKLEKEYPFADRKNGEAWQAEMNALTQGLRASSDNEAKQAAQQFLTERDARRKALGLSPALAEYEQQREWLEGLAKYTEVQVGRLAAETGTYQPVPALASDADFKNYRGAQEYWTREVNQITLTLGSDEVRFYYSGMAQAMLLDRLAPDWRARVLSEDVTLEDLLRQATKRMTVAESLKLCSRVAPLTPLRSAEPTLCPRAPASRHFVPRSHRERG